METSFLTGKVESSSVQICIHGHFYQPPRENPFTGLIPPEPGAEPYANFNDKITAECYSPNAKLNNYRNISFNFGPTLAAWLEKNDPVTYRNVIQADSSNVEKYGYGNALAQVYNHVIMPLARPEDMRVQIEWGIADFQRRFGHLPEGMWLAEAAVNSTVLELLADCGIKFTILAPWQAYHDSVETIDPLEHQLEQTRLRSNVLGSLSHQFHQDERLQWAASVALEHAIIPETFDPNEPYEVTLRNGKSIIVFFYNAPLSGGVSFDHGATSDADSFVKNWIAPQVNLDKLERGVDQLITIATDGELYGHHKSYRDLFLKRLVEHSIEAAGFNVTFPSHWLRTHPPRRKIRILENTSWSCFHGVKRWGEGCDCTPGDTSWKKYLRLAFNVLGMEADRLFNENSPKLFVDPNAALREWLQVYLGFQNENDFAPIHLRLPSDKNMEAARRLLMAQIYKHQMYTSCAWFFEDIDRIEPRNALAAAAITIRLLGRQLNRAAVEQFQHYLEQARSNKPHHYNGLQLYKRGVRWSQRHQVELLISD
ncbi:MAG: DUF3536 domain-containing protein [Chloroflexi bacterium]|uniref:DUF3536 domain-containing protein n=1 Tax=Candidatus Chlorohelix allophototropha TaxID=3003348 RepID=A0A8T7M8B5_9CHLR|nr:DUF3536 domain-containing protein [Chloroflexota bacterium]